MENWLIVGLGNPGLKYEKTRHNLGFMLINLLARETGAQVKRVECRSLIGRATFENRKVELVKPQTFMNLSGEAAACLLKKPERTIEKLIIVYDDLALPIGKIRLRPKGSAGGHNGIKSMTACLNSEEYIRVRIGIQPEHPIGDTSRFVLSDFSKAELKEIEKTLDETVEAIRTIIAEGIEAAMAKFN